MQGCRWWRDCEANAGRSVLFESRHPHGATLDAQESRPSCGGGVFQRRQSAGPSWLRTGGSDLAVLRGSGARRPHTPSSSSSIGAASTGGRGTCRGARGLEVTARGHGSAGWRLGIRGESTTRRVSERRTSTSTTPSETTCGRLKRCPSSASAPTTTVSAPSMSRSANGRPSPRSRTTSSWKPDTSEARARK